MLAAGADANVEEVKKSKMFIFKLGTSVPQSYHFLKADTVS
jgi:hypothetical protein